MVCAWTAERCKTRLRIFLSDPPNRSVSGRAAFNGENQLKQTGDEGMEQDDGAKGSFVPPWAFAMLLPWVGLKGYEMATSSGGMQGLPGALLAILLIGVGIPYVVYRIAGGVQKSAIISMAVVAAMGLIGQATVLMRGPAVTFKESPELTAFVRLILTDSDATRGDLGAKLRAKIADAEVGLEGDELLMAKAYHAGMYNEWFFQAMQQRYIRELKERDVLGAVREMDRSRVVQINGARGTLKEIVRVGEKIKEFTATEHSKMMKAVIKAGGSERKARQIADQISEQSAAEERQILAEATLDVWRVYLEMASIYVGGVVRDSSGNVVRGKAVAAELKQKLADAEQELKTAAERFEAAAKL